MEYRFRNGNTKPSLKQQIEVAKRIKQAKIKYEEAKRSTPKVWRQQPGCAASVGKYINTFSQVGYLVPTVKEIFVDLRGKPNSDPEVSKAAKRCARYVEKLEQGKYDEEGNNAGNRVRLQGAGRPTHAPEVAAELFQYFLSIRHNVVGRLSQTSMLDKATALYREYKTAKEELGEVPDSLVPNPRWIQDWRKAHRVSFKHPNKRYSINDVDRKRRVIQFLKNVWRTRYFYKSKFKKEPVFVSADQMPIHRNESASSKTYATTGSSESSFVRENDKLARERYTVMTAVTSSDSIAKPKLEFVFKGKGTRTKITPPSGVNYQWAEKGSYRLQHLLTYISRLPTQNAAMFEQLRVPFTLDNYSVHCLPEVEQALYDKGYFLILIGGGITGDVQVNDTRYHNPSKKKYRQIEQEAMLEKLRESTAIPVPSRDEMMKWFKEAWDSCDQIDKREAFISNMMLLPFDGSLDHQASRRLWDLVGEEMLAFRDELLASPAPKTFKDLRKQIIPPEGVKRKATQSSVPADEGFELLDGDFVSGDEDEEEDVENEVVEDVPTVSEDSQPESADSQTAPADVPTETADLPTEAAIAPAGNDAVPSGSSDVPKDEELKLLHEFRNTVNQFCERTNSSLLLPMFSRVNSIVAATRTKAMKRKRREENSTPVLSKKTKPSDSDSEDDRDAWGLYD